MQEKGDFYLSKTDSINKTIQDQKLSSKFKDYDDLTFKLLDNYLGNCYEYKGEYLFRQKRFDQALDAYNSASNYYGEFTFQKVSLLNKKANVYYMLSDYDNCLKVIEECILLSKEQNLQNEEEIALELKIKVLNRLGLSSEIESSLVDSYSDLHSYLRYDKSTENSYLNSSLEIFENLNEKQSDRFEFIYPSISYLKNLDNFDDRGLLSFSSDLFQKKYNTNQYEGSLINDLTFASNKKITNSGFVNSYKMLLRNVNTDLKNSIEYENSNNHQLLSGLDSNYDCQVKTQEVLLENRILDEEKMG